MSLLAIAAIVVLSLLGLAAAVWIFLDLRFYFVSQRYQKSLFRLVEPILLQLEQGKTPDAADILQAAGDPRLRDDLYSMLVYHKRDDLFPKEFSTWEAMTAGDLIRWLCHPNELGCVPDEIELMAKVPSAEDSGRFYFVYRFRTRPPHWCASEGWLAGVAGPHRLTAEPTPGSDYVFSGFDPYDRYPPEEHVGRTLDLLRPKHGTAKSRRGGAKKH